MSASLDLHSFQKRVYDFEISFSLIALIRSTMVPTCKYCISQKFTARRAIAGNTSRKEFFLILSIVFVLNMD